MTLFTNENWSGGQFLALYIALLFSVIWLGFAIPRHLRGRGRAAHALDDEDSAYLAGGAERFFELIIARLLTSERVAVTAQKTFEIARSATPRNASEASVLAISSPAGWSAIQRALRPHAETRRNKLVADGQLMGASQVRGIRIAQTLPYLLLIAFGISRWRYGNALDHPTGFLTALLILTTIFALMRWFTTERRTQSGIASIEDAQARAERLRRAPTPGEIPLAVALFGTVVLVGSGLTAFHQMRTDNNGSGDGGGGGGGDSGGGGCGGGGCGGGGCGG